MWMMMFLFMIMTVMVVVMVIVDKIMLITMIMDNSLNRQNTSAYALRKQRLVLYARVNVRYQSIHI